MASYDFVKDGDDDVNDTKSDLLRVLRQPSITIVTTTAATGALAVVAAAAAATVAGVAETTAGGGAGVSSPLSRTPRFSKCTPR